MKLRKLAIAWGMSLGLCLNGAPAALAQENPQPLSLAQCQQWAEAQNPTLTASALDAKLAEVARLQNLHRFGFTVEAGPTIARSNKPTQATFLTGGIATLDEWTHDYRVALRQSLQSGGNWALELGMGFLETNSQRVDFNPSFKPELALSLAQPLWRNAWLGAKELEQAALEAQAAWLRLLDQRGQLRLEVALAYWEWASASQAQAVHLASLKATQRVLAFAKAKVAAGTLAPAESLQAEAAVALREADLLEGGAAVALGEERLWALVGRAGQGPALGHWRPGDRPQPPPLATPSLNQAWEQARLQRPDLRLAQLEEARQSQLVAMAHQAMQPQLDLRLRASTNNVAANLGDSLGALPRLSYLDLQAGLVAVWPLGPNPLADAHDAALLNQAKAQALRAAAENKALAELRLATREVHLAQARLRATHLALQLAQAKMKAEEAKLQAGMGNAFLVLSFQNDAQNAALNEARALILQAQAQARLSRALGLEP